MLDDFISAFHGDSGAEFALPPLLVLDDERVVRRLQKFTKLLVDFGTLPVLGTTQMHI